MRREKAFVRPNIISDRTNWKHDIYSSTRVLFEVRGAIDSRACIFQLSIDILHGKISQKLRQ